MTKQELQEELEARQWRPKQVYTPQEKKALAQVARFKSQTKKIQQKAQVQAYLESSKNAPRNQKGSISLKKSNPIQMCHNDRTEPPSHLLESGGMGVKYNRDNREAQNLKQKLIDEASRAYTARTGQRLQAKSYEWSAVCNIKPTTTMQDLERLAKHFESKYGFQCYQIAIHRDEGYIDDNGQEQINHHAHLEFITLDKETGRNRQRELKKQDTSRIQTEVAEILQMERGIDKRISKRERIEPRHFAKLADEIKQETKIHKEREALQLETSRVKHIHKTIIDPLCKELGVDTKNKKYTEIGKQAVQEIVSLKDIKAEYEALRKEMIEWGFCNKDDYKIRTDLLKQTIEDAKKKQFTQDDLKTAIANATQAILEKHKQDIETLQKSHKQEKQALEAKISDLESKQGVSITQDEISDLKANYEAEKDNKDYKTREDYQNHFQKLEKIVCYGDEVKAREIGKFEVLESIIFELVEFKKAHQELQREPRQVQIQVKAKSKDFER